MNRTTDASVDAAPSNPAPSSAKGAPILYIVKSERLLFLYDEGRLWFHCKIALGKSPAGMKKIQGDGKTPIGEYAVCTRNQQSKFYRSLGLNYPSSVDALRGFSSGLIDKETCHAILHAVSKGQRPPWDTPLGGEIMIHGGGTESGDWTQGCIAVDNADMDVLFARCPLGAKVFIEE